MDRETQLGSTGSHYAVPRAVAGPSGARCMERRPNTEPDTPCPPPLIRRVEPGTLPPACMERGRSRHYRMMTCWDGPRYPAFNHYEARLRSFQKRSWPHKKRSPGSFAAAGLFYTGTDLCISRSYIISTPYPIYISLSIISLQDTPMRHAAFIAVGDLGDGWGTRTTHGARTHSGSPTVSTYGSSWTEAIRSLLLRPLMPAMCRDIDARSYSVLLCTAAYNTNKAWF